MPARFWELAAGGVIAALPARGAARPWIAAGASICIVVACFVPLGHFPGAGALPVVVATAALLWAVHQGGELGVAGRLLRSSPMVGVGLISYSLYLWHWPLLAFYRAGSIGQGSTLVRLILCAVAVLLAIGSYRYIEQPFRRARWPKGRLLAGGAVLSLLVALSACAYGYKVQTSEAAKPTDNPLAVKTENDQPPGWKRCHYQVWNDGTLRTGCETIRDQPARIVLWGDSMAMAWQPFVDALGQQARQSAIDYSRDACGPFLGYVPSSPFPGDIKCRNWNAQVLEHAKQADTVILVGMWRPYFTGDVSGRRAALHATLVALAAVPHVVILGPTPEMRDLVPRCIRAGNVDACAISRTQFDTDTTHILADLRAAAAGITNVHVVDMADFFCTTATCPAMKDGYALYWDSHHVSYTAAKAYARRYTANEVKSK
jgi:SGNH domain (fused to AT3 domains)